MSCSSGPPAPKPGVWVLETPKVNPAEALMPGLLKLKPDVFEVPNPPRLDEPMLEPIPEEKGVPKLAPKGACGPGAGCCC